MRQSFITRYSSGDSRASAQPGDLALGLDHVTLRHNRHPNSFYESVRPDPAAMISFLVTL